MILKINLCFRSRSTVTDSEADSTDTVNKRLSRSLSNILKGKNRAGRFFRRNKKQETVTTWAVGNETYQPGSTQSDETEEYDGKLGLRVGLYIIIIIRVAPIVSEFRYDVRTENSFQEWKLKKNTTYVNFHKLTLLMRLILRWFD